jgi:hypothetical protein
MHFLYNFILYPDYDRLFVNNSWVDYHLIYCNFLYVLVVSDTMFVGAGR